MSNTSPYPPDLPALLDQLDEVLDHALPAQRVAERNAAVRLLQRTLCHAGSTLIARSPRSVCATSNDTR